MNSLSTGIGNAKGASAHVAMLRMGMIKGIKPANTAPFNTSRGNRYIYTMVGGWIDMAHFMFYAGRAYYYKQQKQQALDIIHSDELSYMSQEAQLQLLQQASLDPLGESLQDGFLQEFVDYFTARHSAYSYEDLPSDKYGADFGANYFNPNSDESFSEQIMHYMKGVLKATSPDKSPNYNDIPEDYPDKPSQTNKTSKPLFLIK
jgi:hypothetical protein